MYKYVWIIILIIFEIAGIANLIYQYKEWKGIDLGDNGWIITWVVLNIIGIATVFITSLFKFLA